MYNSIVSFTRKKGRKKKKETDSLKELYHNLPTYVRQYYSPLFFSFPQRKKSRKKRKESIKGSKL